MIAGEEEKIIEWDNNIRGFRIKKEPIRKIVEGKVKEVEGKIIEKVKKLGFVMERILTESQIEDLVDVIARDIYDFLKTTFSKGNNVYSDLFFSEQRREFLIKSLNEAFEIRIREEIEKQAKEVEEEMEKMINDDLGKGGVKEWNN